ncbi:MAG: hypothetical protein FWD57_15590 [Polyangiaceae bacterium]|nr:hypothetical protein [Polyangiaceae bacterium]
MNSRLLNRVLALAVVVWLLAWAERDARADLVLPPWIFTVPVEVGCGHMATMVEPTTSFDYFYGNWTGGPEHQKTLRHHFYWDFRFVASDWRDDMDPDRSGWNQQTHIGLPYARTMNALFVLAYGVSTTSPTKRDKNDPNFALRAYNYSRTGLKNLRANCDTSAIAHANRGKKTITVHRPFYYMREQIPPVRAGTIVHEARHIRGNCVHQGSCPAGASCDPNFLNGCVGKDSANGKGANGYKLIWLNWFATTARPGQINDVIRSQVVDRGNWIIDHRFGTHPGIRMHSSGCIYETKK